MSDCKCKCGEPVVVRVTLDGATLGASRIAIRPDYSEARAAARKEQNLSEKTARCVVLYEDRIQQLREQVLRRVVESPGVHISVLLGEFGRHWPNSALVAVLDLARSRYVVLSRLLAGEDGTLHPTFDGVELVETLDRQLEAAARGER